MFVTRARSHTQVGLNKQMLLKCQYQQYKEKKRMSHSYVQIQGND
jgi:hypothetical protein